MILNDFKYNKELKNYYDVCLEHFIIIDYNICDTVIDFNRSYQHNRLNSCHHCGISISGISY